MDIFSPAQRAPSPTVSLGNRTHKPWRLTLLLLLLLAVPAALAAADPIYPVQSQFLSGEDLSGVTFNFTRMSGAEVEFNVSDATVTNANATFACSTTGVPAETVAPLKLMVRGTTVTDGTIRLRGLFPRNSTLMFSNTRATMTGNRAVFDLQEHVPVFGVVLYIQDTVADWPADGTDNGPVMLMGGELRQRLLEQSAFYFTRTNATNAGGMIKFTSVIMKEQVTDQGTLEEAVFPYCLDIYDGLLSFDYGTCTNCTGPFFYMDASSCAVEVSTNGVLRFANNTMTGEQPFFRSTSKNVIGLVVGEDGYCIFSGIETDGALFDTQSDISQQTQAGDAVSMFTLMHIKAPLLSTCSKCKIPRYTLIASQMIYMGNVTLGGALINNSIAAYNAAKLYPTYIVDAYGKLLVSAQRSGVLPELNAVDSASVAFCQFSNTASTSFEKLPNGTEWRAHCNCKDGYFQPYCTSVYDPYLYYAGYSLDPQVCAVSYCSECAWGHEDQCSNCLPGFKLDSDAQCVNEECQVTGCTMCSSSPTTCESCVAHKVPSEDGSTCVDPIDHCSSYANSGICISCEAGYKPDELGSSCVPKGCNVANCTKCVLDREDACESCGDGMKVSDSQGCEAAGSDTTLSKGTIAGIVIGAILALLLILLIIFLVLRCRKNNDYYEYVDPQASSEAEKTIQKKEEEDTEVQLNDATDLIHYFDTDQNAMNPLQPTVETATEPEKDTEGCKQHRRRPRSLRPQGLDIADVDFDECGEIEEPDIVGGRRRRYTRTRRAQSMTVADVDLDAMYNDNNAIIEETDL